MRQRTLVALIAISHILGDVKRKIEQPEFKPASIIGHLNAWTYRTKLFIIVVLWYCAKNTSSKLLKTMLFISLALFAYEYLYWLTNLNTD
jgi:hypothetical protein